MIGVGELSALGAGLALRGSPENRWRRVAVTITSAMAMAMLLIGASAVLMLLREDARSSNHFMQITEDPAPSDLLLVTGADSWEGNRITVVWIEPADDNVAPVLPIGLPALLARGTTAVSPALASLIATEPELAARYPQHSVLEADAMGRGDELLAYVRPREPQFDVSGSYLHSRGGQLEGQGPVKRAARFGPPDHDSVSLVINTAERLPGQYLAIGLAGMIGIPLLVVVIVGLSAASPVRAARFKLLAAIGAPRSAVRWISAVECGLLSAPGSIGVVLLWTIISPHISHVPVLNRGIFPGDWSWPVWSYPLIAVVGIVIAGLIGYMQVGPRGKSGGPRPTLTRSPLRWWMMLPLGMGAAAFAGMLIANNRLDADLAFVGGGLAVAGIAAITPALCRACGLLLGRIDSVPAFLSGRILSWRPEWVSSTFVGVAVILVLTLGSAGYAASIDYSHQAVNEDRSEGPIVSQIEVIEQASLDQLNSLSERLPGQLVAPIGGHDHDVDPTSQRISLGVTCLQLQVQIAELTCELGDYALSDRDDQIVSRWASQRFGFGANAYALADPATIEAHHIAVIGKGSASDLDRITRNAAIGVFTIVLVSTRAAATSTSELSAWIAAGLVVANGALAISCLTALANRLVRARADHRGLVNLGAKPRQVAAIFGWLFGAPFLAVASASFIVGLAVCSVMIYRAAMPWPTIVIIASITGIIAIIGIVANAVIGARAILHPAE